MGIISLSNSLLAPIVGAGGEGPAGILGSAVQNYDASKPYFFWIDPETGEIGEWISPLTGDKFRQVAAGYYPFLITNPDGTKSVSFQGDHFFNYSEVASTPWIDNTTHTVAYIYRNRDRLAVDYGTFTCLDGTTGGFQFDDSNGNNRALYGNGSLLVNGLEDIESTSYGIDIFAADGTDADIYMYKGNDIPITDEPPASDTALQWFDGTLTDAGLGSGLLQLTDRTGRENHGEYNTIPEVVPVAGADRAVGNFENDFVTLNDHCLNGNTPFEFGFEFIADSTATNFNGIYWETASGSRSVFILARTDGKIEFRFYYTDNSYLSCITADVLIDDSYHKVDYCKYDGIDTVDISIDGVVESFAVDTNKTFATSDKAYLGYRESIYFKGHLWNFRNCVGLIPIDEHAGAIVYYDNGSVAGIVTDGAPITFRDNGIVNKIKPNNGTGTDTALLDSYGMLANTWYTRTELAAKLSPDEVFTATSDFDVYRQVIYPSGNDFGDITITKQALGYIGYGTDSTALTAVTASVTDYVQAGTGTSTYLMGNGTNYAKADIHQILVWDKQLTSAQIELIVPVLQATWFPTVAPVTFNGEQVTFNGEPVLFTPPFPPQ